MIKRKSITVAAGSTAVLFDIGEEFVSGSVWVLEVSPDGSTVTRKVTGELGNHIKLEPAPAPGQVLNLIYEVAALSNGGGMTEYDYQRMEKIAEILSKQADQIKILNEGLLQRITKKEMLRWQDLS